MSLSNINMDMLLKKLHKKHPYKIKSETVVAKSIIDLHIIDPGLVSRRLQYTFYRASHWMPQLKY